MDQSQINDIHAQFHQKVLMAQNNLMLAALNLDGTDAKESELIAAGKYYHHAKDNYRKMRESFGHKD